MIWSTRRTLVTPPATAAVALGTVKQHLQIPEDVADDNSLILRLIETATTAIQEQLRRQLVTATWDVKGDAFPGSNGAIEAPLAPLSSVTSITYVDTNGVTQTLAASKYLVDAISEPARIEPAYGEIWPTTRSQANAVTVRGSFGYGAQAAVPQGLQAAIAILVRHLFMNANPVETSGSQPVEMPLHLSYVLELFRWHGNE